MEQCEFANKESLVIACASNMVKAELINSDEVQQAIELLEQYSIPDLICTMIETHNQMEELAKQQGHQDYYLAVDIRRIGAN